MSHIPVVEYKRRSSEHLLQASVLDYLAIKGKPDVMACAFPNAGKRTPRMGMRMKAEGMIPGAPDLIIILPRGRCAFLEFKALRGYQTPEQKGFQARCARLGHIYEVVKTFEQAVFFLAEIGALR